MLPIVYKIEVGPYFYIGCTGFFLKRINNHSSELNKLISGLEVLNKYRNFKKEYLQEYGYKFKVLAAFKDYKMARGFEKKILCLNKSNEFLINIRKSGDGGWIKKDWVEIHNNIFVN